MIKNGSENGFTIIKLVISIGCLLVVMSGALWFFSKSQVIYNNERATLDIGAKNMGSHGDMRTNNETINGVFGYIDIGNGTVTGSAFATNPQPDPGASEPNPITIDTGAVSNGQGASFSPSSEHYAQLLLTFPVVPNPPAPPAGAVNYSYSSKSSATLPPNSHGYNNIDVSKGQLTIPPGNYGAINVDTQGTIVLGTQGRAPFTTSRPSLAVLRARSFSRGR